MDNPRPHQIVARWKYVPSPQGGSDIDFRLYREDGTPIMIRGGVNRDMDEYHAGQISSSMGWAVIDAREHFAVHLGELFPEGYTITFEPEPSHSTPNIKWDGGDLYINGDYKGYLWWSKEGQTHIFTDADGTERSTCSNGDDSVAISRSIEIAQEGQGNG